jgi:hypothetical protein
MAKARKTRRAKHRRATPTRQVRPSVAAREEAVKAQQPAPVSFAEEYQYVIADLKRIFILAAGMLALLVVLALVLQ